MTVRQIVFTTFVMCVALAAASPARAENLEPLFPAPAFKLTDQDGRTVTDADLRGKTWVVNFVFTRCGGVCPLMTQRLVGVAKKIDHPDVRFVSISVDPAYDTPAVLKKYAADQGATDPRFVFLTGEVDTIYDLAQKGFKMTALPAKGNEPIQHDERYLLIGPDAQVRGIYHTNRGADMRRLVVEADALANGKLPAGDDDAVTTGPTAGKAPPAWVMRMPAINASLNATAGIFLCVAMMMIQAKRIRAHAYLMIAAVATSTLFLACYLTYHYMKGGLVTRYPDVSYKTLYFVILISHTILAVVVLPLVIVTLVRAYRRQWDKHRRIARPTFWIWLYVSATGVLVYWMLYHLAPRLARQAMVV